MEAREPTQRQQKDAAAFAGLTMQQEQGDEEWEEEEEGMGKEPRCPMAEALERGFPFGYLSFLTFSWAGPFLKLGASRTLTEEDLVGIGERQKRSGVASAVNERRCGGVVHVLDHLGAKLCIRVIWSSCMLHGSASLMHVR